MDSELTIEELKQRVKKFCEDRDWDQFHGAKDLAIGIITEAGELLENFRFKSEQEIEAMKEDFNRGIVCIDDNAYKDAYQAALKENKTAGQ